MVVGSKEKFQIAGPEYVCIYNHFGQIPRTGNGYAFNHISRLIHTPSSLRFWSFQSHQSKPGNLPIVNFVKGIPYDSPVGYPTGQSVN
jgi:hypothetical protein